MRNIELSNIALPHLTTQTAKIYGRGKDAFI